MEMYAVRKVNWCGTLQAIKDEKKSFEANPIVNGKPVKPELGFFCRKGALVD